LSSAWNIFSAPDVAPALEESDAAEPDVAELPVELFSLALGAPVVPPALPADPLPLVVCAARGVAKAAATAKAITVLKFISISLRCAGCARVYETSVR
jgi:hypothetical protein